MSEFKARRVYGIGARVAQHGHAERVIASRRSVPVGDRHGEARWADLRAGEDRIGAGETVAPDERERTGTVVAIGRRHVNPDRRDAVRAAGRIGAQRRDGRALVDRRAHRHAAGADLAALELQAHPRADAGLDIEEARRARAPRAGAAGSGGREAQHVLRARGDAADERRDGGWLISHEGGHSATSGRPATPAQ